MGLYLSKNMLYNMVRVYLYMCFVCAVGLYYNKLALPTDDDADAARVTSIYGVTFVCGHSQQFIEWRCLTINRHGKSEKTMTNGERADSKISLHEIYVINCGCEMGGRRWTTVWDPMQYMLHLILRFYEIRKKIGSIFKWGFIRGVNTAEYAFVVVKESTTSLRNDMRN